MTLLTEAMAALLAMKVKNVSHDTEPATARHRSKVGPPRREASANVD
jgi:hypothetical protein